SIESIPRDLRNLRACLLCSMIKTLDQFEQDGCDNCERFLGMKGDEEKVSECTRREGCTPFRCPAHCRRISSRN
uniref:Spt4/RpoE2 zinc finger domain-containing protein n=1 Tax=Parascaris univalens TaxID=6257 RepID=A0A915C3X2_PARUN